MVAGSVALWLQANPRLTYNDVIRIIRQTAVVDDDVRQGDSVQWGAGKFDAYAGMKEVLREATTDISGIKSQHADKPLVTSCGQRTFRVLLAGARQLRISVYNLAGQRVLTKDTNGDETSIDTSRWGNGCYILQVNGLPAQRITIY